MILKLDGNSFLGSIPLTVKILVPLDGSHYEGREIQTIVKESGELEGPQRATASFDHDMNDFEEKKTETDGAQSLRQQLAGHDPCQKIIPAQIHEQPDVDTQRNPKSRAWMPENEPYEQVTQ